MKIDLGVGISYVSKNIKNILIGVILSVFALKGLFGYWKSFEDYIVTKRLQEQGFALQTEEKVLINKTDSVGNIIVKVAEEIKKKDYQKLKHEKGIIITDADVLNLNSDSLVARYKGSPKKLR